MSDSAAVLLGKRKSMAIGIAAAMMLLLGIVLFSCAGSLDAGEAGAGHAISTVLDETAEGINAPDSGTANNGGAGTESEKSASAHSDFDNGQSEPSQIGNPKPIDSPSDQANGESSEGNPFSSASAPAQGTSQKRWVEDTERVWVVDKEAWTESVPVYGAVEVSICNICGTDITGNTSAHEKEHMKAGEGSGHHSEVRQVAIRYNTINHKEEGHYETRVTGGHWG